MLFHIRAVTARAVSVGFLAFVLSAPAFAVTKTWTNNNGTGDGRWLTAANWSPAGVPTSSDDVEIGVTDQTSSYCTIDGAAVAQSFTLGNVFTNNPTLEIKSGATLTISAASTTDNGTTLYLNNGSVAGSGALAVSGQVNFNGGQLSGAGALTINSGGVIHFQLGANYCYLSRNTTNDGTIQINTGAYDAYLLTSAVITNNGLIDFQADETLWTSGGGPFTIDNQATGIVRKSGGSGTSALKCAVNNATSGLIESDSGTLSLDGGGTSTGAFDASAGTVINFSTTAYNLNAGTTVTGSGKISLSGTVNVESVADITIANLHLVNSSAKIDGTGIVRVSTLLDWDAGSMAGAGQTIITSGATLNIDCSASWCYLDSRSLNLALTSTTNYTPTVYALYMQNGAALNLSSTATFNIQTDQDFNNGGGATSSITNGGTIQKTSGSGATVFNIPLTSTGTISVTSGDLQFPLSTTINGGSISIGTTSNFDITGNVFNFQSAATITNTGNFRVVGGTMRVPTGVTQVIPKLTFSGGYIDGGGTLQLQGTTTWSGGTMGSASATGGTTEVLTGSTLNMTGTTTYAYLDQDRQLLNNGTVNYIGTTYGFYVYNSSDITNNGVFDIQNDHGVNTAGSGPRVFTNNGTLNKSAGTAAAGAYFYMELDNAAAGTINVTSGRLNLHGGGTNSGAFTIGSGAFIQITNDYDFAGTPTVSGLGTLRVAGGNMIVPSGVTLAVAQLVFDSGYISGAGTLQLTGTATWNGGTMGHSTYPGGTTRIMTGAALTIAGTTYTYLDQARSLVNDDTLTYSAPTYYFAIYNSATLTNNGTFDYATDLGIGASGVSSSIANSGLIQKTAGSGTATIGVPVNNTGTIQADLGTLLMSGGGTHTGGDFIGNGAGSVGFSGGTHTLDATSTLTGTGGIVVTNGTVTTAGPYDPVNLTISNGTLTLDSNGTTDVFTMSSGTLNGSGTLTIKDDSTWSGGTMSGTGTTILDALQTMTVSASTNYIYLETRTFTNNGTINYSAAPYYWQIYNNATLNNAGAFNLTTDQQLYGYGSGTINNSGTFTKSAGTGTSAVSTIFNNTGSVTASSGILAFSGNGAHTGAFTATSTIAFSGGTHSISAPATISGAGTLAFTGANVTSAVGFTVGTLKVTNGTATFNANATADVLDMSNGTFNGSGQLTLNNGGTWTGGVMGGSGSTVVPSLQTLNVTASSSYCYIDTRTVTNNGTINYTATPYYMYLQNGGTLTNNGSFAILGGTDLSGTSGGTFNNAGTVTKSVGTNTMTIAVPFNNSGSLSVSTGTVALSGGGTHTGSFSFPSPATLAFSGGIHTASGAGAMSGTGTLLFSGATITSALGYTAGTLTVTGGTATLNANGSADAFSMSAGTLGGIGTLTLNNGGTWTGGTMTGSGTTVVPAGKTLTINSAATYNTLEGGRTLSNLGTINYAGGPYYFQVYNSGVVNNAGALNITSGAYLYGFSSGTINNTGTITSSATSLSFAPILNNSGQLTVTGGTLSLDGGGTHTNGVFTATSPGVLQFGGGTHTLSGTGSIGGTGNYLVTNGSVTIGVPYTIASYSMTNGTATFNTNGTIGSFSFSNGTISGIGTLTITDNGTWAGGTMSGSGTTVLSAGKTYTFGGNTYVSMDGRTVNNNGTINYVIPNSYYWQIYNNGTLNNAGTLALQTEMYIYGFSGGTINNTGTISRTTGSANATPIYAILNNDGTILVTQGGVELRGNGTHNGTFTATTPGFVNFAAGTHVATASSTLGGTGTHRFSGGSVTVDGTWGGTPIEISAGTATFNTNATIPSLMLTSSGILTGSGNVTVTGNSTWSGGTMDGAGTTTFDTGSVVTMNGATGYTTLSRALQNLGTINYSTPTYYLQIDGSTLTNDGTFDVQTATIVYSYGTSPSFVNNGTLKKTAGAGTMQFYAPLSNAGTVQVGAGTMYFSNTYVQSAGITELLNNATLQTTTLDINGGSLIGTGTVSGAVTSDGIVAPGASAGSLTITGNYTQSAAGALNIELGGTTAGTQYDQLVVQGSVTLGGDLNISTINSFLPASGNTFQILTFGSRPGSTDFANKNGLNLGFGTNLIPAYSATDLQLTTNTVQADIAIAMTATPASVNTGDSFTYNVSVTNNGGSNASGVGFSAPLPANVTFVSASPAICTGAPNLTCTIGNLADQATTNVTITVTTTAAGTAPMTVSAAASQFDPNGANNTANASVTVNANADLSVSVTNTLAPVAGATSDYSIVVTNNGPDTANSVTLAITPSAQLTFSSATGACTNGFPCALGNLTAGQSVTITATWSVSPNATGNAQIAAGVSAASPADLDSSDDTSTATNAIAQEADVAVIKTGPSNVPPESGSTVTYSIAVTNNGPSEASAVTLDDPTPSGLTQLSVTGDCATIPCNLGVMSVGQTSNVQVTYSISGAIGTSYTNTATVTSAADNNGANDSSSVVTTVSNCPATSIAAPAAVNGGSSGNVASVTNVAGATYNWSIGNGTITGGQGTPSITFTAGTSGTVSLGVNVTSGACASNPTAVVTINPVEADLSVTKTGPANVSPTTASTITYSIDVTNNGPAAANSVTLSDPTPPNLTFVSATGACASFPCSLGTLANGETANVQATYSFTGGSAYAVTNVATVSSSNDPNSGNNSASVVTNVAACPAISITAPNSLEPGAAGTATATVVSGASYNWSITNGTITGGQGTNTINLTSGPSGTVSLSVTVSVGSCATTANAAFPVTATTLSVTKTGPTNVSPTNASTITYTINVTNGGASAANSVTLSDPTPADLTFVSATGACTAFPCSLGTLNSGQSASVQATYSFTGGPAYSVTNVATVTSSSDPNPHTASITTAISACPTISITAPTALNPGANGAASATAISGATYNWSITNGTLTGGQGTNNITFTTGVIGTTQLGVNVTAGQCTGSATHQIAVTSNQADVAIIKSAPASVASGANFTYTLTITNNGPANADAVTVTDTLPANVTFVSVSSGLCTSGPNVNCSLGTLAAGASQVITIDVTAPQGPATLTNIATVSTTSADPNNSNDSSSATTAVSAPPVQCPPNEPNLVAPENGATNLTSPVTFDWDPVANATLYELWIGATGDDLTLAATTANTAFTLDLSSGTFDWQVIATGAQSCTPKPSVVRSFTIPQIDTCAGNGVATGLSPGSGTFTSPVTLAWNAVPNAIGYVARYRLGNEALQEAGPMTTATSLTASFPPGVITFVVDTLFSGCPSTRSGEASFTVEQPATCEGVATLTQPANGISTSNGSIEFRWTAVSSSSGYRVWLQSGASAPEVLASTLDNTLTKVVPAGTHSWWVETLFPGCASRESQKFTFTVLPAQNCDDRGRPALLSPSIDFTTANAAVDFSWTAVANAIEYELYLAPVGGVPTLIATTPSTSATAEVSAGHLEWFVRAIFSGCGATESDHRRFTYEPPPNCTANERAVLYAPSEGERIASSIFFDWNDVAGATSYELYVSHGNAEPQLVRTTTISESAGVQRQLGAGRWFVRTRFAQGCAALDSTETRFVVIPEVAACSELEAPVISAPGQISSGVEGLLQWSFVPGATAYTLEVSDDPAFPDGSSITTSNMRQQPFQFANSGSEPMARYIRVRAIDTRCDPSNLGPYSSTAILYILPETTAEGSSPIGEANLVEYTLTLGPELAGEPFTATPTASWITVSPSNGTVPPGGRTLTVVVNTAGLPPGTNIGGVAITTGSSGRIGTAGTTVTKPVSISLVSPVTPTPKNTPPPDALVIPAVANADGIGSHFQSDVRVSNTSAQVMKYQLSFIPSGEAGITAGRQTTFSIEPGRTVALDDILKTWFGTGTTNSVGSLEIRPLTEVAKSTSSAAVGALANLVTFASSRTFNITPNGTFGQYIPAIPFANFVDQSKVLSLQQIAHSSQYRTNLGLLEGSGEQANLLVKVFGSTGAKLTEFEVLLKGGQHTQLNGFLSQHGITSLDDGRVEVSVTSGSGKVTAYASVLDNNTADPLLVSPVTLSDSANTKWVVPGVADLNNGAANWQTDMRVFNAGSTPEALTLSFYSQNGGAPKVTSMTLQPGEVRQLDKILTGTFGVSQNGGAVHVTSADSARLIATARTYNLTTQGTYGQFIAAVTPAEAVGVGSRPLQLLQVEESPRYRSNIGLAEVTGKPVSLEVSIVPPDAKLTATVQVDLAANEFRQITSMLAGLGMGDVYNARVTVRAIGGEGRATAYASVIDAKTNDPTYVPAQ